MMNNALLDPWSDAQEIARRLRQPAARLIVVLVAETWCDKCRELRAVVENRAAQAAGNETWLWLDLEEHAEFLGDYLPDDLPQVLSYEQGRIAQFQTVQPSPSALETALLSGGVHPARDPGIYQRLLSDDWAL